METRDIGRGKLFYDKFWHTHGEQGGVWILMQVAAYLLADSGLKIVEMTEEEKSNPLYPKIVKERP